MSSASIPVHPDHLLDLNQTHGEILAALGRAEQQCSAALDGIDTARIWLGQVMAKVIEIREGTIER